MTSLSMAGNFNPLQKMFIPMAGVDYSAYLGGPQGSLGLSMPQLSIPQVSMPANIINGINSPSGANNGYMYNPLQIRAEGLTLNRNIKNLYSCIGNGEADKVETNFAAFKSEYMKTSEYKMLTRGLTDIDDKMISEMCADKYRNVTGIDLADHIDNGVRGNWFAGFWNGATLGIFQFKSSDDVKHDLLGEDISTGAKVAKTTGSIMGAAAVGAAIGTPFGGPVGAAIGGGIGAICGLVSRLWS